MYKKLSVMLLGLLAASGAVQAEEILRPILLPRPPIVLLLKPDLVVDSIADPIYVNASRTTQIQAVVQNIGRVASRSCFATIRNQRTGATNTVLVPALAAGASATLHFTLPGSVFQPDASLRVTVDSFYNVDESNERNNTRDYFRIG